MLNNNVVSIITVCRNSAQTIEQTIRSVLQQTYPNIEYIIIDGASTDGTVDVIERYRSQLAFYVSEPDNGIYCAMNKGLRHASGDIIGILNSDDWYESDAIEQVVGCFETYQCEMVHGKMAMVYSDNSIRIIGERSLEDLYTGMTISHPTVFLKRSIYTQYGSFDETYQSAADYELMLRLYTKGVSIQFLPKVLTYFRRGGFSERAAEQNMRETYDISKHYIEKHPDKNREVLQYRLEEIARERKKQYEIKGILDALHTDQIEELTERIASQKEVVIFGTGFGGTFCYEILSRLPVIISAWIDNDVQKQGSFYIGFPVYAVDQINKTKHKVIVSTNIYEEEMCEQLQEMGWEQEAYTTLSEVEKVIMSYGA